MGTNMYIRFEEPAITSDTPAVGHESELEILSWSHGFSQPTSPTSSAAGPGTVEQATHQSLSFTKYLDAATNTLLKYCWSLKQIGKATITCYRVSGAADNQPIKYLEIAMQHVVISNYSVSGGPGGLPVENLSLNYGIVKYTYIGQKDGQPGTMPTATHDLETRTIV